MDSKIDSYQVPRAYRPVYRQLLSYARRNGWYLYDIRYGIFERHGVVICFHKSTGNDYINLYSSKFWIYSPNYRYDARDLNRRLFK